VCDSVAKTGPVHSIFTGFFALGAPSYVGAKPMNPPTSNSSKQSKYKCLILLERSFENLSGWDITSLSKESVEGAHRLRFPMRVMTHTKSGKRWHCPIRRHRLLGMSTRVSETGAEVYTSSHGEDISLMYRDFCIGLSARVGLVAPE